MTPEEFAKAMSEIFPSTGYDEECAHGQADELMGAVLNQLGYGEGVRIFEAADKWYA